MKERTEEIIRNRITELREQLSQIREGRISGITEDSVLTRLNELERLQVSLGTPQNTKPVGLDKWQFNPLTRTVHDD